MALDLIPILEAVRPIVDGLRVDRIRWTVAPDGVRDDVLDLSTLELTAAGRVVVWEGPCSIVARNPGGQTTQAHIAEGGHDEWAGRYTVKQPLSAVDIPPAAEGEMLASRDPWLVGKTLICIGPTGKTYGLSRAIEAELRQGG